MCFLRQQTPTNKIIIGISTSYYCNPCRRLESPENPVVISTNGRDLLSKGYVLRGFLSRTSFEMTTGFLGDFSSLSA
jgi:hypothetical protein